MNRVSIQRYASGAVVLAFAACVSLSSPAGRQENVPITRGNYRNGRDQAVRIALATNATDGKISSTGKWRLWVGDSEYPVSDNGTEVWGIGVDAGRLRLERPGRTDYSTGLLVARPSDQSSVIVWNGKRYRGDVSIAATDSGLLVVNTLPMDSYLRGVVPLEIGNRTEAELAAVQAQAVAARTYAYKHLSTTRGFDMYSTVQDQVYGGVDAEKPLSDQGINSTQDMVMLFAGEPINTPYHSTCGGSTAAVSEVWYREPDEPYLRPVSDKIPGTDKFYCDPSPKFSWTQNFDTDGLRATMDKYLAAYTNAPKAGAGRILDIREQGRTPSNRVAGLIVRTDSGTYTIRGNDIRFVLRDAKGTTLNSTFFTFTTDNAGGEVSNLTVNGRGYGHGIGMCQWGAIGRARAGQNYRTILETYYPGTTIGRIAG
ncbi:MAG TPA: SpoIID/LytB domain-containing protein [Gemmatimonadaceae bacterium]|jgi:stage II sporulation protein D